MVENEVKRNNRSQQIMFSVKTSNSRNCLPEASSITLVLADSAAQFHSENPSLHPVKDLQLKCVCIELSHYSVCLQCVPFPYCRRFFLYIYLSISLNFNNLQ